MAAVALRSGGLLAQEAAAVVDAPCGRLRGVVVADGVRVFKGVPFAEPPVGPLRFRAPVKKAAWSGELAATKLAPAAMQSAGPSTPVSEDCLYLNVFAPAEGVAKGQGLPVLVWIHGGGNVSGRSSGTDGVSFARDGVVCVTVAYRLGVLGFLDVSPMLGKEYAGSANNGLRDLIAALEWVQENIAAFGGDPARVTVGGQSAGAKLTDTLLGTPAAESLFVQGISESGGAERVWATAAEGEALGGFFGKLWKTGSGGSLLSASADAIVQAQSRLLKEWLHARPFRPAIDGVLLKKMPVAAIVSGAAKGKRVLIGTSREDSVVFVGPHPSTVKAQDLMSLPEERFAPVEAKYAALYPQLTEEQRRVRAVTAEEYWVPSVRAADALVSGSASVWMYLTEFHEGSGKFGDFSYHGEELSMVWNHPLKGIANADGEATLTVAMHAAWLAFLNGAAPAGPGMPTWPLYKAGERQTLIVDVPMRVESRPQEAELRLWDGVM